MICASCKAENRAEASYCDACGGLLKPPNGGVDNSVAGGVGRDNLQAGRDITIQTGPELPEVNYEVKWHWASPITQAKLGWTSLALGVVSVLGGVQALGPLIGAVTGEVPPAAVMFPEGSTWIYIFIVGFLLFVTAMALRRIAKHETQHLTWVGLPTITGWGHRLGLARLVGTCRCGGRLRFYNKPMQWLVHADGSRGKVTERHAAAECVVNHEHFGLIDKTERPA